MFKVMFAVGDRARQFLRDAFFGWRHCTNTAYEEKFSNVQQEDTAQISSIITCKIAEWCQIFWGLVSRRNFMLPRSSAETSERPELCRPNRIKRRCLSSHRNPGSIRSQQNSSTHAAESGCRKTSVRVCDAGRLLSTFEICF